MSIKETERGSLIHSMIGRLCVIAAAMFFSVRSICSATSMTDHGSNDAATMLVASPAAVFICVYGLLACLYVWRVRGTMVVRDSIADFALAAGIQGCETAIDSDKTKLEKCVESVGKCTEKIKSLSASVKELSEYKLPKDVLGQAIKGVYDLDSKCKAAGVSVDGFSTSISACNGNVSSMNSEVSTNATKVKEFSQAVGELDHVLDRLANLLRVRIDEAMMSG